MSSIERRAGLDSATLCAAALCSAILFAAACSDGGPSGNGGNAATGAGAIGAAASGGMGGAVTGGASGASGQGGSAAAGASGAAGNSVGDGGALPVTGGSGGDGDGDGGLSDSGGPAMLAYEDPGSEPWVPVPEADVEEVCHLDPALLAQADTQLNTPYVIIRYGKLCHEYYPGTETPMTSAEVYSTTKSFGALVVGIANYETRDIPRTGPKTGQLSDWDRVDHWLDTFTYNQEAHVAHVLAMVGHNTSLAHGSKQHSYDTVGDIQINSLSDMVNTAIAQDPDRLGANIEEFTQRFLFDPLGMELSTWSGGAVDKVFAYTWSSNVREMARVGLLINNRGFWDGRRVLDEEWVYKMTHPAFEDGNTSYGYLTWLASWSNHSIGFSPPTAQGANIVGINGAPCAPVALWNTYPHGELSEATDCNYESPYTCEQMHDVGVWQAVGLGGQLIQGHPGLDLVIAARNDALGGAGLWSAIIPAVAGGDPMYQGDTAAFCEAYSASEYAPDLKTPWPVYD